MFRKYLAGIIERKEDILQTYYAGCISAYPADDNQRFLSIFTVENVYIILLGDAIFLHIKKIICSCAAVDHAHSSAPSQRLMELFLSEKICHRTAKWFINYTKHSQDSLVKIYRDNINFSPIQNIFLLSFVKYLQPLYIVEVKKIY